MQDLRDLYKAYSAVHDTTIKEELDNSKDQITEMNLSKMRDEDLIEVAEEIIEGLFQYGKTLDEAYDVVGSILEEAADNIIGDRKVKITRIAEAFDKAFDTVTDKAERNCEESFLKYRQTKPLTEKWHNKVSHEVGNAKVHASIIHEDRETMKTGLIEMISVKLEQTITSSSGTTKVQPGAGSVHRGPASNKKMTAKPTGPSPFTKTEALDPVGKEDADIDNDGDTDSSDKYLAKRRKAIGKAMKKEETVKEGTRTGVMIPSRIDDFNSNAGRLGKPKIVAPGGGGQYGSGKDNYGTGVMKLKGGGLVKKVKMKKEETQVAELYKGKHGQSEKEYADSRSQGGKMVSGDSKGSGAEYTHGRRVKAENPGMQPDVGGKTKPKSQGKMDAGSREDLKYRKARMFSKEELEAIQAKVDSWE